MTKEPWSSRFLTPRDVTTSCQCSTCGRTIRLAGLAHYGNAGGQFPRHAPRLEWNAVPAGFTQIEAPTPYVWIIGRTKTDGPPDYDAVQKSKPVTRVTPVSEWDKPPSLYEVKIDPSIDMKTPPKTQVDTMKADRYFAYAAELSKVNPPHPTDQPMIARMKRIGIEPGKSFDSDKPDPVVQKALEDALADGQKFMAVESADHSSGCEYWSMNTDTMGVYGNYYLKRAIVAELGLGANVPEDAIYPLNLADETGKPLDGANKYTIHFDKGAPPPVNAFWSITLYDTEGFQVANSLNRFAVSSWMPFKYNPMARSTSTSRTRARERTKRPTGFLRRRGHST